MSGCECFKGLTSWESSVPGLSSDIKIENCRERGRVTALQWAPRDTGVTMDYWETNLIIRWWSIYNDHPPGPRCQLSGPPDMPRIIGGGRDHWHNNFHAPPCVMKWHFYCIIFTASVSVSSMLYVEIYLLLFTGEKMYIFSSISLLCSRHPPAAVIATLHNSWQNYGRKLAHNYAHSKVILNVYLADFFHSILVGFWLFINESFLLGVLKCQYWEGNKNPAAFQEV